VYPKHARYQATLRPEPDSQLDGCRAQMQR
jgi:hypothetical protein